MILELKKSVLVLACMFVILFAMGQIEGAPPKTNFTVTTSTPEAEAIKKNQTDFVDYSKGTVSVRIPLGQLPVEGYNWPWMLSYSTKGIKVNEIASNVGLGWSFNGVGMITSKMIGRSDLAIPISDDANILRRELNLASQVTSNGQPCSYYSPTDISLANDIATLSTVGLRHFLPDVFFLNIGNLNYKFFLQDTIGYTMPASNIKIRLYRNNPPYRFIVTDEEGVNYYLSAKGNNAFTSDCPGQKRNMDDLNYVFYLDSLKNGVGDVVKFYYSDQYIYYQGTPVITRNLTYPQNYSINTACGNFYPAQDLIECISDYNAKEARLDSVVTSQGSRIIFSYASRSDLQPNGSPVGSRMTGFSIYNELREIKKVAFVQSYFGPSGSTNPNELRLKLDSVKLINTLNSNDIKKYGFAYNSTALPDRISYAQDTAGYYNGQNANTSLIPKYADRSFNAFYAKAGILEKITFPEGGGSRFEYELNPTGEGGLRVSKIVDSSGIINSVRKYAYTFSVPKKVFNFEEHKVVPINRPYQAGPDFPIEYWLGYCDYSTFYSTPTTDITDSYDDESIFYSSVEEVFGENGEGGKKIYYYESPPQYNYASVRLDPVLKKTETYKKVAGSYQFQQAQINIYNTFYSPSLGRYDEPVTSSEKRVWGKEFKRIQEQHQMFDQGAGAGQGPGMCMPFIFYQTSIVLVSQPLVLTSSIDSIVADNQQVLKTVTYYDYGILAHLKPITIEKINSKGDHEVTRYRYAGDLPMPSATTPVNKSIRNLLLKNMQAAEIEKAVFVQTAGVGSYKLLNASLNIYDENYPKVTRLFTVERQSLLTDFVSCGVSGGDFVYDNRYEERESIATIGARANTMEYLRTNDFTTAVHWDKYNIYPVAKISNTTLANTAYTSFEDDAKGNWSYTGAITPGSTVAGKRKYSLSGSPISKASLNAAVKYIVSYWSNGGSYTVSGSMTLTTGKSIDTWTYYEHLVTGVSSVTVSGSGQIDELRLYPQGSLMTTFNYDHFIGLISQTTERNNILKYEYDGFNRLLRIRDEDNHILKQFEYKFQSTVFSSSCATIPNWQNVRTECSGSNLMQVQLDINPCSITYNTERSIVMIANHPPCMVCTGPDKKMINGVCETGIKKTTASRRIGPGTWECTYHYEWSDGSHSPDYTENSSSPCLILP